MRNVSGLSVVPVFPLPTLNMIFLAGSIELVSFEPIMAC